MAQAETGAAPPVMFQGRLFRQKKNYWQGTHRTCSPQETMERIRPHFAQVGLTRLANVTGLDCLGIPVVLSVRPNSAYLSVDAGKGVSLEDASASAAMECIERYTAEMTRLPSFTCSYDELNGDYEVPPLANLALSKGSLFSPRRDEEWTLGWDIVNQRQVAVPLIMTCLLGRHTRPPSELFSFQVGSNGLASGNAFLEAVCAGLYEVIERDAVTCQRMVRRIIGRDIPMVRLETITHPLVADMLERFRKNQVQPALFDCTVDTQVPTYMAYLHDQSSQKIGIYRGYGTHLDPGIAMIRALNEAAQARLVYISGARDDFFQQDLMRLKKNDTSRTPDVLDPARATLDAGNLENLATGSFEGDVDIMVKRLARINLTQVIVFDLTLPGFDISVIRVMVPGLEGYLLKYYSPGPRVMAMVERIKADREGGLQ